MPREQRATIEELEHRVEMVRGLISRCCTAGMIKRVMRAEYAKKGVELDHRTILGYIARARKQIEADAGRGKKVLRAESHAFYGSVLRDDKVATRDKLKARERLDRLHGLEAPTEFRMSDVDEQIEAELARVAASSEGQAAQSPERNGHG